MALKYFSNMYTCVYTNKKVTYMYIKTHNKLKTHELTT